MKPQNKAYAYALGAVVLWSTVATAFKIALNSTSFVTLLFISSLTAFLALWIINRFSSTGKPKKATSARSLWMAALRGLLNPFLYYLVLFKAYELLPAQEAMSLNYVWPMVLVLLSIPLLGQKIHWISLLALIISFSGVLAIATHGNLASLEFANPKGASLALGSSIIWALFWIINLKSKEEDSYKLLLSFGFGTLYIIPLWLFKGMEIPESKGIVAAVYVGLAEMGLAFFLWLKGLALSERTDQVSRLIYLSPFLSLFFIATILGEKIGIYTLVGLLLIISGILLSQWKSSTAKAK